MSKDSKLIDRFVASFERVEEDELDCFHYGSPPHELIVGPASIGGQNDFRWRPKAISTPAAALDIVHARVGALPQLYEQLVLSYRWLEVDLRVCCLLENPPGDDLQSLSMELVAEHGMNDTLLPAGFVRFGMAPDSCCDPVCFDLNRLAGGDCPIMRFEHESILMYDKIGDREQIFDSFRELMVAVLNIEHDL